MTETADPYGTAELRRRVLEAWAASPARFREDANAEEELVRGAYRDRVIVELAQNAADAAAVAGATGRLLLRFNGDVLVAANSGAPLDARGVEALSTLRASAKRDDGSGVVGRFGVGFAAVLAVTDAPSVASRDGGVRWARDDAAALAADVPGLNAEIAARRGAVPILRLPFADSGDVPDRYDTAVRLAMRDATASALVDRLLDEVDDALLLALPSLAEVVIERNGATRTLRTAGLGSDAAAVDATGSAGAASAAASGRTSASSSAGTREDAVRTVVCVSSTSDASGSGHATTSWRVASASGNVPEELRASRPVEEQGSWTATVAVPSADDGTPRELPDGFRRVIHAPTPTDDPCGLPVLIMAGWPLDSSRRHVQPGPLTDFLASRVAEAYAVLVREVATAGPAVLDLIPGPMAAGAVDATLHRAITAELSRTPFVPRAQSMIMINQRGNGTLNEHDHEELRPHDAVVVDGAASAAEPAALVAFVPDLAAPDWWRPGGLERLGARRVTLADVVDTLADVQAEPVQWHGVYSALQGADVAALATLPVPLSDGRTVRGARGVLVPTGAVAPERLEALGLRVVHPEAAHPLLERLGARAGEPASVLRDPVVRGLVERLADEPTGELDETAAGRVADAMLDLASASGLGVTDEPWLARLLLPDGTGTLAEAGELWFPGASLLNWLDGEPAECAVSDDLVRQHGRAVLAAVGVQTGFSTLLERDVPLEPDAAEVPDFDSWVDAALAELGHPDEPPLLAELLAVRDLDLVREDAWPAVLGSLAGDPATHAVLTGLAWAVLSDGTRRRVPSYTSWWLRTFARIDGHVVGELCAPDADSVVRELLHPAPSKLGREVASALGIVRSLDDLIAVPRLLLDRLADREVQLSAAVLGRIYWALGASDPDVAPPEQIRVAGPGGGSDVVAADSVVVASSPQWLQLDLAALIPGPEALATVLDVDLAEDRYRSMPESQGVAVPVPDVVLRIVPDAPSTFYEHDDLRVCGTSVGWWVDESGTITAATSDGLARAVAWTSGRWDVRLLLAAALSDPDAVDTLIAEHTYG